jgi:hypothetical protein
MSDQREVSTPSGSQPSFLIWSFRNRQWWGPNHEGYTLDQARAGRYNYDEAAEIVFSGLPGGSLAIEVSRLTERLAGLDAAQIEEELDGWRRL